MNRRELIMGSLATLGASKYAFSMAMANEKPSMVERPEWEAFFKKYNVDGTITIIDERQSEGVQVYNSKRAAQRFVPASTFKVPHALFALEAGVVKDEFQVFKWDGKKRWLSTWNRDQTLKSSMRYSAVWVYQELARQIGLERERKFLESIDYGNADPGSEIDKFWLDGSLTISALEQLAFLRKLHRNALPFKTEHQRLVKATMINAATKNWVLHAKTGWALRTGTDIGWWIGWVDRLDAPIFFALNIAMPNGKKEAPARTAIARKILTSIGAFKG